MALFASCDALNNSQVEPKRLSGTRQPSGGGSLPANLNRTRTSWEYLTLRATRVRRTRQALFYRPDLVRRLRRTLVAEGTRPNLRCSPPLDTIEVAPYFLYNNHYEAHYELFRDVSNSAATVR